MEEILQRLPVEEVLQRIPAEDFLQRLSIEELKAYVAKLEKESGLEKDKKD